MELEIYQVDAFADKVFAGNPAAVVPLQRWLPEAMMQAIAAENNVAETAFIVSDDEQFHIRWFTPTVEVPLCGHATLAAAAVLCERLGVQDKNLSFMSKSGELGVSTSATGRYTLDFPARSCVSVEAPAALLAAMAGAGEVLPVPECYRDSNDNYLLVYPDQASIAALTPGMAQLAGIDHHAVIASAPGESHDFVSRFFAPRVGIDEDPVTGSAHCTLVPYWAARLAKSKLLARQISARGGELACELRAGRVLMTGTAAHYLQGRITV